MNKYLDARALDDLPNGTHRAFTVRDHDFINFACDAGDSVPFR